MSPSPIVHWAVNGDELLADGQWHDGLKWMRVAETGITPGVAMRFAENVRAHAAARRAGVPKDRAPARKRELPMGAQVAAGKRQMLVRLIHGRVRVGLVEVAPWPLPKDAWRTGGWRVRLAPRRYSPNELETKYRISSQKIRELILFTPALPHQVKGRTLTISANELPELERRIAVYRRQSPMRRRAAARRRWENAAQQERTEIPISVLSKESHLDLRTGRRLMAANPDLGWIARGSRTYLPLSARPEWDRLVEMYHREHPRSASAVCASEARRSDQREVRPGPASPDGVAQ